MDALPYYLLIGALAGSLSGLLGIGGGIIIIPSLMWVFRHFELAQHANVHLATGSSLATIIFISLGASIAHYQRKTIIWPLFWRLVPGLIFGSISGALITQFLPGSLLKIIFGLFLLLVAYRMAFASQLTKFRHLPRIRRLSLLGSMVGFQAGLLGIGAGSMLVPYFTRCHLRMRNAAGTSIICSLPISIIGTITLVLATRHITTSTAWSTGYVYWPATLSVAVTSLIFAPMGVQLARRWSNARLKRLFSMILVFTAGEMIWPSLKHLFFTIT